MIEIFSHRAIFEGKENSLFGIEKNLKSGFNIEIDVRKFDSKIYLSHDQKNNSDKMELFENACEIIKNYTKKVAIHVKEDFNLEVLEELILKYDIGKKCFIFSTFEKEINVEHLDIGKYQNEQKNISNVKILWCDESKGKWYDGKIFSDNKKNNVLTITMSRELLMKSSFEDIKNEWKRLIKLGTDGICTDHPNELKMLLSEELQ